METTGTMETEGAPLWIPKETLEKAERDTAEIKKRMSRPGALGLPELLDQRRLEFGIPDSAWRIQAAFNKVLVHQIPDVMFEKGTYGDTGILMPKSAEEGRKKTAPRGIVVSAGLTALDYLRSHGIDLGHIVTYVRIAPLRVEYDLIAGEFFYLFPMLATDIWASEDTATALRKRHLALVSEKDQHGVITHKYRGADGVTVKPLELETE